MLPDLHVYSQALLFGWQRKRKAQAPGAYLRVGVEGSGGVNKGLEQLLLLQNGLQVVQMAKDYL
ncbi:hypothetical protein NUACC21_35190 [Scytonema sp. NUACC21]